MRTLEEILAIPEIERKIYYLKKGRKTEQPNVQALYNDWNPNKHEIVIDEEKYPKIKITTQPEKRITDPTTGKEYVEPAVKKEVDPNRIALPIEQDIVNIQTAFTVGTEPILQARTDGRRLTVGIEAGVQEEQNQVPEQKSRPCMACRAGSSRVLVRGA